jgi:hypothetical protein
VRIRKQCHTGGRASFGRPRFPSVEDPNAGRCRFALPPLYGQVLWDWVRMGDDEGATETEIYD